MTSLCVNMLVNGEEGRKEAKKPDTASGSQHGMNWQHPVELSEYII